MSKILEKEIMIAPSQADATGKLGFADCFDMFMDIASEHAEELGVGITAIGPKGLFWLTVKSKIHFYRRPLITEKVSVFTWPEKTLGTRCYRSYKLTKGDEILAEGRTQWAVMDMAKGLLVDVNELYPDDYNYVDPNFKLEDYEKPQDCSSDSGNDDKCLPYATYTVSYNDIDLGKHMNNVAYVRAFLNSFSTDDWKMMNPKEIEIHYIKSCLEGDTLTFSKSIKGNTMYAKGTIDDKPVVFYRVEMA